jgi:predicted nicotinamide N-methyase
VIEHATKPAVAINLKDKRELWDKTSFVAGSWQSLSEHLTQNFDVILMSETLYNTAYYDSLVSFISHCLSAEGGLVIIGTKTFYFGLGGGTFEFQTYLNTSPLWTN